MYLNVVTRKLCEILITVCFDIPNIMQDSVFPMHDMTGGHGLGGACGFDPCSHIKGNSVPKACWADVLYIQCTCTCMVRRILQEWTQTWKELKGRIWVYPSIRLYHITSHCIAEFLDINIQHSITLHCIEHRHRQHSTTHDSPTYM